MDAAIRDAIMLAVTPIIQDAKRDRECAHAVIGGLLAAGYAIVPINPTGAMMVKGEQAGMAYLLEAREDMTLREARPSVCCEIYKAMIANA